MQATGCQIFMPANMKSMNSILISLCMIIKNEAENLSRCLDSVKGYVDEIILVDTGSTDDTIEIGLSYGAKIFPFQWVDDFSAARNHGLEKARGEWILVLDADEALDKHSGYSLRSTLIESDADAYNCILRNVVSINPRFTYHEQVFQGWIRIFRNRPQYRFESAYHESVFPSLLYHHAKIKNSSFIIWHYGMLKDQVQGGELSRQERSWHYLQKAVEKEPNNGNLLFFLGNEYYSRGDFEKAYNTLKRAALEVGIEVAHPYQAKKGLIVLAEFSYQKGEYEQAAGCAKGALAIKEYTELNQWAWTLLCNSFTIAIQKGIEQAYAYSYTDQRKRALCHYLTLLDEFNDEVQARLNTVVSDFEKNSFSNCLQTIQQLSAWIQEAL